MADKELDLSRILGNLNAKILITIAGGAAVQGFVTGEIPIGGSNQFNSPAEEFLQSKLGKIGQIFTSITGVQLKSPRATTESWIGSSKPLFSIPMVFIAVRKNDDPRENVKKLLTTVFPQLTSTGFLRAPLGYNPITRGGLTIVQIGKWFRATNQLVRSVDFQISEKTTPAGFPLFATGTVTFSPFQQVTARQVQRYFVDPPRST